MIENIDLKIGMHVVMRKKHACGENDWLIIRYGADVKLECYKCKRQIMMERPKFLRNVKKILDNEKG